MEIQDNEIAGPSNGIGLPSLRTRYTTAVAVDEGPMKPRRVTINTDLPELKLPVIFREEVGLETTWDVFFRHFEVKFDETRHQIVAAGHLVRKDCLIKYTAERFKRDEFNIKIIEKRRKGREIEVIRRVRPVLAQPVQQQSAPEPVPSTSNQSAAGTAGDDAQESAIPLPRALARRALKRKNNDTTTVIVNRLDHIIGMLNEFLTWKNIEEREKMERQEKRERKKQQHRSRKGRGQWVCTREHVTESDESSD